MKIASLLVVILFVLSACDVHEKNTPVDPESSSLNDATNIENTKGSTQGSPEYLAKDENKLSDLDFETAYEMCVRALTEYYKAVWNGSDIELDTFIINDNLKQYTQKKIQSQYNVRLENYLTNNLVRNIDIGAWEAAFTEDVDGDYIYLFLPVEINMSIGGYGEATEFLVRNLNGRLVIVDWYTGAKDSYDFIVRGENQVINNSNIWNDNEWTKQLNSEMDGKDIPFR